MKVCSISTIVFHNFTLYDSHIVLKNFKKELTERAKRGSKVVYDDVKVFAKIRG